MVIGTSALRSFCHSTQAKRNKLADGIPLCETMHYKVLLADSICNQDGMGVAAALAKATEDQSVVMNLFRDALELWVDSVPPEPSALSSATRVSCVASGSGAVGGLSGGCRTQCQEECCSTVCGSSLTFAKGPSRIDRCFVGWQFL